MSREFGLLDNSKPKGGGGITREQALKALMIFQIIGVLKRRLPVVEDHLALLKQKAIKLPKNIEQWVYSSQQMCLIFNRE